MNVIVVFSLLPQAMAMSPDNRVGIQEKEPVGSITVLRLVNPRGGPSRGSSSADVQKEKTFFNAQEASEWIAEDRGEHFHYVMLPFGEGHRISAWVKGNFQDQLVLEVKELGRKVVVNRTVDGHHGAVAPGLVVSSLWVPIIDSDERNAIIDRGTAWVTVNNNKPTLEFAFLPEEHAIEDLLATFNSVNKRAHEVFADIMSGSIPEAF